MREKKIILDKKKKKKKKKKKRIIFKKTRYLKIQLYKISHQAYYFSTHGFANFEDGELALAPPPNIFAGMLIPAFSMLNSDDCVAKRLKIIKESFKMKKKVSSSTKKACTSFPCVHLISVKN